MVTIACPIPQQSSPLSREKLNTHEQTKIPRTSVASLESKYSKQMMPIVASIEVVMVITPSNLASMPIIPFNHQVHFIAK